jgi:hypothetical protein
MSSPKEKITRLYVGELPLIKNFVERLGLKEIFAKYIKSHKNEKIPAVDSLMILLFNITCGRQPLYELELDSSLNVVIVKIIVLISNKLCII